jgi:hypothetical protein
LLTSPSNSFLPSPSIGSTLLPSTFLRVSLYARDVFCIFYRKNSCIKILRWLPEFKKGFCPDCIVYCLANSKQTPPPPPIPNLTNLSPKPVNFGSEFLLPTKPIGVGN